MKKLYILLIVFLFASCQDDKPLLITGKVIDDATKKPIADAKVTILCWYDAGWDKTDYISVDMKTNSTGFYSATFKKGEKISIGSIAKGYGPTMQEQNRGNDITQNINLYLKRNNLNEDISDFKLREYIVYKSN